MRIQSRRAWLIGLLFAAPLLVATGRGQEVASLTDTLKARLKCRRQVEFDFVDLVVAKVNEGKLPTDLVLNTMTYARSKRDDIPFPYFQQAIRLRAAKIGVHL